MQKNKLYNFLIILLLYIAFSCIPFELFIKNSNVCLYVRIAVQVVFLVVSFLIVKFKTDFDIKLKKRNVKTALILAPTILVVASNFLYLAFVPSDINIRIGIELLPKILLTVFVVLNEEFIFRLLFLTNFKNGSNWKKILLSSAIFAASHLTVFFSTFNPYDLIVPVYTFAFGVLLGIIFTKTNSIEMCVLFHLLFNVFNSILFESMVPSVSKLGFYFLANVIVVVVAAGYLLFLLLTKKLIINERSEN